jgi:hypothetical protein
MLSLRAKGGRHVTTTPDETLETLRHEVDAWLGRCVLELQIFELRLKAIVAHREVSGAPHDLPALVARHVARAGRMTLGMLIGELLESYLIRESDGPPAEPTRDVPAPWVVYRVRMALPDADLERTRQALEELVAQRNDLVHHFIQRHDLTRVDGCRAARDALIATRDLIRQHNDEARAWVEDIDRTRAVFEKSLLDEQNRGLIFGETTPRKPLELRHTRIVKALRKAAREVAVGGLTRLDDAVQWISVRHPAERPQAYGRNDWAEVVIESGVFELLVADPDGRRVIYYRETA